MNVRTLRTISVATTAALWVCAWAPTFAHRTVISQYTYSEHVRPILEARCGGCHRGTDAISVPLLRYEEARRQSWRMQQELLSGRMPPWDADESGEPLKGAARLTPHEFDVLMTWAAGGTPEGVATAPGVGPADPVPLRVWPLGEPDVVLTLPAVDTSGDTATSQVREFSLPTAALRGRSLRAVDVRPGTAAVVRRAEFAIVSAAGDQVVGVWLAGERSISPEGAAFAVPRGATLRVRLVYQRPASPTGRPLMNRSALGLYLAPKDARPVESRLLAEGPTTIPAPARALAWRVTSAPPDVVVRLALLLPDGTERLLARARPDADWPRRHVFERPVDLPPGSRLVLSSAPSPLTMLHTLLGRPASGAALPVRVAIDLTR